MFKYLINDIIYMLIRNTNYSLKDAENASNILLTFASNNLNL